MFLLLVMSLNCVSLITATVVMNIKRRSQNEPVPKVAPWLLYLCEHYLSRITCTSISDWKKIATIPKETTNPITDMLARAREESAYNYGSFRQTVSRGPPSRSHDQYVQLHDISPAGFGQKCDTIMKTSGGSRNLERCMTAESTFSTASCTDGFIREAEYTDHLIKARKDLTSDITHSTSENPLCSIDDELPGNSVTKQYSENSAMSITLAHEYRTARHRQSYRRAVGAGYYTALKKVPRPRKREVPARRVQFKSRLRRNDSFLAGISHKYQWYFVADVIDTLFFIIYVVIMFIGILTVLVIVPIFA